MQDLVSRWWWQPNEDTRSVFTLNTDRVVSLGWFAAGPLSWCRWRIADTCTGYLHRAIGCSETDRFTKCLTRKGLSDFSGLWFCRIASHDGTNNALD